SQSHPAPVDRTTSRRDRLPEELGRDDQCLGLRLLQDARLSGCVPVVPRGPGDLPVAAAAGGGRSQAGLAPRLTGTESLQYRVRLLARWETRDGPGILRAIARI